LTDGTIVQTLNNLEEWAKREAHSSRFLDFYISLLRIQAEVESGIGAAKHQMSENAVCNRMANGKPLLRFDDLAADWPLVEDAFNKVVAVFAGYPEFFGPIPEALTKPGYKLPKKITKDWFEGKGLPDSVTGEAIDPRLLDSLINQSLRPFLISHSQALIGLVDQAIWWRGYCPVCGGCPDIAYLEKEVGERWLMCCRCDARWRFQRLACPSCGNQEPKSLSCFADDEKVYRLYVCDKCRTYLKAVDLRNVETDIFLPLERLMTYDMDRQGQEMGYQPGYTKTV
jgi:FdhE protein